MRKIFYSFAALCLAVTGLTSNAERPYTYSAGDNVTIGTLTGENLITNGDFSNGIAGWNSNLNTPVTSANFEVVNSGGPNGAAYMHAKGDGGTGNVASLQTSWAVEPGKIYFFSCWVKGNTGYLRYGLTKDGADPGSDSNKAEQIQPNYGSSSDWTHLAVCLEVPESGDYKYLTFNAAWLGGKTDFSSFGLYEVEKTTETNLLRNPGFDNDGEYWDLTETTGTHSFSGEEVTLTSGGADEVLYQPVYLLPGRKYLFGVKYKTESYNEKHAFCGFWSYNNGKAQWVSGAKYSDYAATEEWTEVNSSIQPGLMSTQTVILACNGGATAYYKAPYLVEEPDLSIVSDGVVGGAAVALGSTITLQGLPDGWKAYYRVNGENPTEIGEAGFTAPNEPCVLTVYAYYEELQRRFSEITVYVVADATDLMPVIVGKDSMTRPTNEPTEEDPWFAYNTSTQAFGAADGDGWEYRNNEGDRTAGSGDAEQLFLRWNTVNSPYVYGYKLHLEGDNTYILTMDATDNNNRGYVLLVGMTQDLSEVTNPNSIPNQVAYDLTGHNHTDLWTSPFKIAQDFNITETGDYYLLFACQSTPATDDIIRIANVNFYKRSAISYQQSFEDLKAEIEASMENIGFDPDGKDEAINLADIMYAENITDYKTAWINLQAAFTAFEEAAPVYEEYQSLCQEAMSYSMDDMIEGYATKESSAAFAQALQANPTTKADATSAIITIKNTWRAVVESAAVVAGERERGATEQTLSSWSTTIGTESGQPATLADGTELNSYLNEYQNGAKTATTTATLNKGIYRFAMYARASANVPEFSLTVSYPMASEVTRAEGDFEKNIILNQTGNNGNVFGNGWAINMVDFQVPEDNTLVTFTVNADSGQSGSGAWYSFMNPTLYSVPDGDPTAVSEIEAAADVEAVYYTIDGVKVSGKLAKGLYIKVAGGKTSKVLVK